MKNFEILDKNDKKINIKKAKNFKQKPINFHFLGRIPMKINDSGPKKREPYDFVWCWDPRAGKPNTV